jgi:hypothetical protein
MACCDEPHRSSLGLTSQLEIQKVTAETLERYELGKLEHGGRFSRKPEGIS